MSQAASKRRIALAVVAQLEAGEAVSTVMRRLAAFIVTERMQSQLDLVLRSIKEVMAERGQVVAEVITARQLGSELRTAIKQYVIDSSDAEHVSLDETVDESLLGGVIIRTPGRELDASLRTALRKLRTS